MTTARAVPAAVLLPFYRDTGGALRLILIERTPYGAHGGQIALPGGKYEPSDPTMRATAIRETSEELGIAADTFEVLDGLPSLRTRSTGFQVWPFVGRLLRIPAQWHPQQREVAHVLDLAVADLTDPDIRGTRVMDFATWGGRTEVPVWQLGPHTIWGLTLRILETVLPRVQSHEWPL